MNKKLLERLKRNPHYVMSIEQEREFVMNNREPMIQFGKPEINENKFAKHNTGMVKIKYETKKTDKRLLDKQKRNKR